MSEVTLSKAVRSNLLNLQNTAELMGKTQERLATGLKVNSALDNPTNFFTSSALNARAGDLGTLLDAISNAVQTVEAADNGITAIKTLVESAQATARQALQTSATVEGEVTPEVLASADTGDLSALSATGGTITVNGENVTLAATDDEAAALIAFQAAATANGTFTVTDNGDDTFTIEATSGNDLVIGGDATTLTELGLSAGTTSYTAAVLGDVANPERDNLVTQYNDLLAQIDELAADAGFNGNNLLNGDDLTVLFNADGSSSLTIDGVTFNAAGVGLAALSSGDFDSNTDVNATLDDLGAALATLRTQSSAFGSNLSVVETRQQFTKEMINTLETGAANLTLADTNEEGANMLALQTRQQLSTIALSLASQADQNVLRLF